MSSVLEIIVNGRDNATGVLRNVGGALGNLGESATRAGTKLLPLSAGAAVVAGSALKMAADYEQSMNVLQASSEASTGEMAALGDLAIQLGADMTLPATSAKDAADAMLELSKAGLSVNDTMAAAKGVLQLSAAAQIGNAEAALVTANALNMFKLSGDKATMVADLLAAGANKSSANIQQMADALQMSGNVAANAGLSIGDVTTAIALMANQGIKGSDAGTSLKQMLLSLQGPSGKAADLMKTLGINVYDANGAMLPMPKLIDQFGGALGGLTQEQRNAALATIFGSDAVRSANVLLLGGTEAWNDMSAAVSEGGEAAAMAAAQNKGLGGALDGLKSVVQTTLLTAAKPLLETLAGIVRWVGDLVGRFAEANPQLTTAGIAFAGVLAVAAPLALGIGMISTALGALLAPVGLVVLAVAGLAAAWSTNFGGIRDIAAEVVATVQDILAQLQAFIAKHRDAIMAPITEAWTRIQAIVTKVVDAVQGIVQSVFGQLQTFMAAHGEEIEAFMVQAWQAIGEIVNTTLAIIEAVVPPVLNAIKKFIDEHGTQIQAILEGAWTFIRAVIETTLGVITGILTAVLAVIRGDWSGAWEAIQGVAETVWNGITTIISTALNLIDTLTGGTLTRIANWFTTTWTTIQTTVTTILTAIQTFLSTTWTAIQTTVTTIWTAIQTFLTTTWTAIKTTVTTILTAIQTFLTTTWTAIKTTVTTIWTAISTSLSTTWTTIQRTATSLFGEMQTAIIGKMDDIRTKMIGIWNDIKGRVMGIVNDLINGIKGAFAGFKIHIPLPHFSVSFRSIGFGVSIPDVGVSWYGKGGDFMANSPMLIGVGEAGPERVQITPMGGSKAQRDGKGQMAAGDTYNTYNVTVNTNATSGTYLADLQMARALAW